MVEATDLPVSADLENLLRRFPRGVADDDPGRGRGRPRRLLGRGQHRQRRCSAIYDLRLAADRVVAAAEAAHGSIRLVLTASAENFLHGRPRPRRHDHPPAGLQEAGADVLYAPGLTKLEDIRQVVGSIDRPLNVLAMPGGPTVDELAGLGVARVSVGSAFAYVALGACATAAREFLHEGTTRYFGPPPHGRADLRAAFSA